MQTSLAQRITGFLSAVLTVFLLSSDILASGIASVVCAPYPPFVDPEHPKGGFATELITAAFDAADIDTKIIYQPWARMQFSVIEGSYPVSIGSLSSIKEEWRDKVQFVHVVEARRVFFYNTTRFPIGVQFKSLKNLKGYKVLALIGGGPLQILTEAGIQVYKVSQLDQGFKMLKLGRGDLLAILELTGIQRLQQMSPDMQTEFAFTKPYSVAKAGLFFSKSHQHGMYFYNKFTAGLTVIKENGTYDRILKKHFGKYADLLPSPK